MTRRIIGVLLVLVSLAYAYACFYKLNQHPNVILFGVMLGGGAYLLDPRDISRLAKKAKELIK